MKDVKHVTQRRGKQVAILAQKANVPREGWDAFWSSEDGQNAFNRMKELSLPHTLQSLTDQIKVEMERVFSENLFFDEDILNWVDHKVVNLESSEPVKNLNLWPLPSGGMNEGNMINKLSKEGRFVELTYLQGLQEVLRLLKCGALDKKGTYISIFLSTPLKNGNNCLFRLSRGSVGKLRLSRGSVGKLRLSVYERDADDHRYGCWSVLSQDPQNVDSE